MPWTLPYAFQNLPPIKAVSCSYSVSLFLDLDGNAYSCGLSATGKLGFGKTLEIQSPTVIPGLPPISKISTGNQHSLFLAEDGTVWGCGLNLGDESSNVAQIQNIPPMKQILASDRIFLDERGELWMLSRRCSEGIKLETPNSSAIVGITKNHYLDAEGVVWGYDGHLLAKRINSKQQRFVEPIQSISRTSMHTLYLGVSGTVWGSGSNTAGQLGTFVDRTTNPVKIQNLPVITEICAGDEHSLFVDEESSVWAVGKNDCWQLGMNDSKASFATYKSKSIFTKQRRYRVPNKIPGVYCRTPKCRTDPKSARNI